MRLKKIVSGGQTGVDRAALDAALHAGVPHGGWCPKNRRAEDGPIPEIYALTETATSGYRERTERNVIDSDGTLILTFGALKALSWLNLLFEVRADVERNYRRVVFFVLAVE